MKKVTIFLERNESKQTREKNIKKKKGLASRSGDPRKTHVTQTFFFCLINACYLKVSNSPKEAYPEGKGGKKKLQNRFMK